MDTPNFCVYNLARRVFLSSKVTVADTINQPLKVLKDLVGLDAESGLWLTPLLGRPTIPKLFPYDLAYLDKDLQVIETVEVLPGVDFPAYRREVTSAVVLPPDTLRTTQTRVGDHLLVCAKDEVKTRLGEADSPIGDSIAKNELASLEREAPVGSDGASPPVSCAASGDLGAVGAGAILAASVALQPAATTKAPTVTASAADAGVRKPAVSITEVIIEQPHDSEHQAPGIAQHGIGLEDLFANWVDSPSAPPSWIAQKVREHESAAGSAVADAVPNEAQPIRSAEDGSSDVEKEPSPLQASQVTPPCEQQLAPAPITPPTESPAGVRIPQNPPRTTFTIGQYGMWQFSTPTAVGPKRPVSGGTRQLPVKGSGPAATKRAEGPKAESQTPGKTAEVRASLPLKPREPQPPLHAPETGPPAEETGQTAENEARKIEVKEPSPIPPIEVLPRTVELPVAKPAPEPASKQNRELISGAPTETRPVEAEKHFRGDEIAATAKTTPADFVATVQDKLERVQTPTASTGNGVPAPVPVSNKKRFGSNSLPEAKPNPSPSAAPDKPAAKPEDKKSVPQQHELAVTLPLPRFLKPKPEQKEKLKISIQRVEGNGKNGAESLGFGQRLKRWLQPGPQTKSDRRRAHRRYVPGMVAHYYTGGAPKPYEVADISMTGFYLLTEDRWIPETMIRMTLQKPCAKGERKQSITVLSRIVRRGSDGLAAEFVMQESLDSHSRDVLPSQATDRFALARFL